MATRTSSTRQVILGALSVTAGIALLVISRGIDDVSGFSIAAFWVLLVGGLVVVAVALARRHRAKRGK